MERRIPSLGAILCAGTMLLAISGLGRDGAHANKNPSIDINNIVQQSARVTEADRKASPGYDFAEKDWESGGSYKTYAVRMLYGSPYRELVAVDGEPLPKDKQQDERRKLRDEIARRQHESSEERAHRIAEYQKERTRDRHFIEEFVRAFTFKLIDERQFDGREVYVVEANPLPGYHPTDRDSAVLTGMRGQLWIDKKTDQWAKAEAEVVHPVSMVGFLATVEPGTRFVLEKTPVDGDIWLPRHFTMTAKAHILSVIHHDKHQDVTFFNYHKAGQPTS